MLSNRTDGRMRGDSRYEESDMEEDFDDDDFDDETEPLVVGAMVGEI